MSVVVCGKASPVDEIDRTRTRAGPHLEREGVRLVFAPRRRGGVSRDQRGTENGLAAFIARCGGQRDQITRAARRGRARVAINLDQP